MYKTTKNTHVQFLGSHACKHRDQSQGMIKTTRLASLRWIVAGKKILWEAVIIAVAAVLNL